ncbi:MAG: hypothetical protein H6Q73_4241 [Firmicutes bacterium]|nr:hypothetical protein [Bacillota bacterium]
MATQSFEVLEEGENDISPNDDWSWSRGGERG